MNKIGLIIRREYLTRVKKRSFIIMTILGPLLIAAIYAVPIYLSTASFEQKSVLVLDETNMFFDTFKTTDNYKFQHIFIPLDSAKATFVRNHDDALIYIPKTQNMVPEQAVIFSEKQVSMGLKSFVTERMKKEVETLKLQAKGIDRTLMESIKTKIVVEAVRLNPKGEEEGSYPEIRLGMAFGMGFLIYLFVFMFSSQVMRGVIEEKSSRIVEVIISSVRPFQLMAGKIIGVALVGLTQFLLWVVLTAIIVGSVQFALGQDISSITEQSVASAGSSDDMQKVIESMQKSDTMVYVMESVNSINFTEILLAFIFYFLGGYLLYASLFAAVGSAVDSEADSQQFLLPLTVPLIIALVSLSSLVENPDGQVAFWLSMIPFTSPVIMLARIPFGVPWWEVALSVTLLVLGVIGAIWIAAKIYRTGILMYGKKINYKELWKWLRY